MSIETLINIIFLCNPLNMNLFPKYRRAEEKSCFCGTPTHHKFEEENIRCQKNIKRFEKASKATQEKQIIKMDLLLIHT